MGRKNKKNSDDGSINLGGMLGDFSGWGDIAEDDEEEEEEGEEEDPSSPPPPPPPPPPSGKGKGKGGKNQPHNAGKGGQQQKNQKQNQNQNQNQNQQWGHNDEGNHWQHGRQQQQNTTNDWAQPKRNGQMPGNKKNNNNNNNNNNSKNNKNNKRQPRIEEVEEEEEAAAGWGSAGGDWYNSGAADSGWGAPGETASGVGFVPGTGPGTGVGPGSMAGWPQQSAGNSDWGAPQQSFQRQQDQLASLLHHPRMWTPSVGISDDVRSQLPASAPRSNSGHSHPRGGPPSIANKQPASRTFRHAAGLASASVLNGGAARNGPHTQVQILSSGGTALEAADKALFGHERPSNQRIYWMFSPHKDPRVSSLIEWIQAMNHALATVGIHHLLQTQQRGALFTNADFRHWQFTSEPTFDWLTFDDIVDTYDKTLQESIAFYEVENQVLVFVFLLSPSKNSMAVWRRKVVVPNVIRTQNRAELNKVAKSLSKRKFVLTVDNLPKNQVSPPEPAKAKRKWFQILR